MTIVSAMLLLYSFALLMVLVVGLPYWLVRMATAAKYREGLTQRLGVVPRRLRVTHPRRGGSRGWEEDSAAPETIWVHAVSVGEVVAVVELVRQLRAEGYRVVVSTTTRTGQRLARARFGEAHVFYFPFDLARIVRRYLRVLRPRMLILVETEFWPHVLNECRRAGVEVAVVNARISDRSYPRYLRLRRLWRPLLQRLSLVLAQSELDMERLREIGAPADRVRLGGNLKFDVRPAPTAAVTSALREHLPPGTRVLVCGSTVEGEEAMLIEAWSTLIARAGGGRARLCMVLAPRHPERCVAVAKLLDESGLAWERRTEWMHAQETLRPGSVFLLNSIGELASVYSLASVAFVGGSLVTAGGHNPLEPAQFAVPVVMGPHYQNFRGIVKRLLDADGIRIVGDAGMMSSSRSRRRAADSAPRVSVRPLASLGPSLVKILGELLGDAEEAQALGERGSAVFSSESGATARTVQALLALLADRSRSGGATDNVSDKAAADTLVGVDDADPVLLRSSESARLQTPAAPAGSSSAASTTTSSGSPTSASSTRVEA
ncbi:MAG TPA: glycosyltransferase N-terminal domain-containing protein [Acidisarcina sp.]